MAGGKVKTKAGADGGLSSTLKVAQRAGIEFSAARRFLRAILDELSDGRDVHLTEFGTFLAPVLKGRIVRTPMVPKGKAKFPDKRVLRFRGAQNANRFLNGEREGWK